ncbi:MAG: NUDIX domain-containing protein [Rhodospirillaceae bacterium]|nr:NUDIX domain-containing protein [Rhodospirillaceae bacterium]
MTQQGPANLRVYGVLLRGGRVLMADEQVGGREVLKLPGGAVEVGETPEQGLRREFMEEGSLEIEPTRLLHAPGTLYSHWIHGLYTPMFYEVQGGGEPVTPPEEPVELLFMAPDDAIGSGRMAAPEIVALGRALAATR